MELLSYQERTMVGALALRLKKIIKRFKTYEEFDFSHGKTDVDFMIMMAGSFDGLMNHLRKMMAGYGNEQVTALVKEMEMAITWHPRSRWYVDISRRLDKMVVICEQLCNIRYKSHVEEEEAVVGFDDEIEALLDQLTGPSSTKNIQIISITGMAGLGKTTLAKTLYNHELVMHMFDLRAWACVSQTYVKKDLLLGILSSFMGHLSDEFYEMNEQQLGEKLNRILKCCKYLVAFDDIWDCKAWNDLKMYFPDDKTGSRVLFTSRDTNLSLHVNSASPSHVLRLRTEDESWSIFQKKVFRLGICPGVLEKSGRVMSRKCEGLPLVIVIAAGRLKNNLSITWWGEYVVGLLNNYISITWEKIATSLHSFLVRGPRSYIEFFPLSYYHMPPYLRQCFLFFGAFPEDFEVPVTKLIWLWIAHGFIHETRRRMLEDVAEDFLMDLINRNLVMTHRVKADGHVKTCRVHELLRDFCLRKAKEENFLSNNYRYDKLSSKLCFPLDLGESLQEGGSIHIDTYKFLKILDLESIRISLFPLDAVQMVNLRYLAIQASDGSPHASISNLVNLQTLIICSRKNIVVPETIWNMVNLRHLYIKSGENLMEDPGFLQVTGEDDCPCPGVLARFQTLSHVSPRSACHNIFSRTPNLRKLGFCGPLISAQGDMEFPDLGSLMHLQKLKLLNTFSYPEPSRPCNPIKFPKKLKKLTLLNTGMDWEEMCIFSLLPNLEILKLKFQAFIGESWETGDVKFGSLKVLNLHDLNLQKWVCSRKNFPRLQCLAIHHCLKLDSVPMSLGKILTLEAIEVNGCNLSAYTSAVEIQKQKESEGNPFLKVHGKGNFISYVEKEEEVVVGFDDEIEQLLDQLTRHSSTKHFQIISITGMAGLGKTTLATTLYNHDLVKYMFDFRAWTCVSQTYLKEHLLLSILSSLMGDVIDEFYEMSEQQLGEKLYRKLKGRKYLVAFDDIWDCSVWNDIKMYFPVDESGSRVLFTSRDIDVSSHVTSASPAHVLRLRSQVESWSIFQKKLFRTGIFPHKLEESGREISKKCEGLPLAIVIAAGLLKNNLSFTWWEQIAKSLRTFMVSDPRQYIDSLALSYNHMPPHLRPCFLFFGAFPEDYEVPVTKLIRLWIAQGFIHQTGSKMLEDFGEDFLMDLIKRSLLMTSRIKSDGHVKTCRIHDLLRDFCLRKAEEENFLSNNYRYDMLSSKLCYPLDLRRSLQEGGSFPINTYKFLKILDLESIRISLFPLDAVQMVNLRYLAIQARDGSPHSSISNLVNLQTLIICSRKDIVVPETVWNMVNLRHLYIKSGENLMEDPGFLQVTGDGDCPCPSVLAHFQTLSHVSPRLASHNIFSRTPNLRKLGFFGPLISDEGDMEFPDLGSLMHLQKLKLLNTFSYPKPSRPCNAINFPEKLKKLTLLNTGIDWKEMWNFAWLPNLEVLDLKFQACIGGRWETGDAEFRKLKNLKLRDLDIEQWVCSRDNFPRLQRLAIHRCLKLDDVPVTLGMIYTLEVIEVNGCSLSAYRSALEIQKEQESEGNPFLKVHGKGNA